MLGMGRDVRPIVAATLGDFATGIAHKPIPQYLAVISAPKNTSFATRRIFLCLVDKPLLEAGRKPACGASVLTFMRYLSAFTAPCVALVLWLGACSSGSDEPNARASTTPGAEKSASSASPISAGATQNPADEAAPISPAPASARVLGLEGLGDLRIGQAVPGNGSWAERGAQTGDTCRTVSSPDYPGVYAIVTDGKVRRITLGQRSDVKLVEGLGVGAAEKEVRKRFPGFRERPHKYQEAPAKDLIAPNVSQDSPAMRFEIGRDGKVSLIHVGTMPELEYVEACA